MKFSEHWLRTLVDPPLSSDALAERLTMIGLEVEERSTAAPPFTRVVVGKVLSVERHPNAERLTVCHVDAAQGAPLTIVCGAPNVTAGLLVPCALAGAELPHGVVVKPTTLRGVESQGMLCSARELGLSDDASGLLVLDASVPIGRDLRQVLDLDDPVLTLKLTPNRADCLSLVGVARDLAASTGALLTLPPRPRVPEAPRTQRGVRIEDALACPRFCARVIAGIDAKAPTPAWMRQRLERSGIRSISAVVDITNYVMLEFGQPLHAYDDALLDGDIVVRFPNEGEKLTLLNGQQLLLDPDLLLVADEKKPLGLAGIMGGEHSGINDTTGTVFLEGAFWNPAVIQGKARRLGFVTDAGFRFERGVDFANAPAAVDRATQLILDVCGGQTGSLIDVAGVLPARRRVRVRQSRIERILGITIPGHTVFDIFQRLGLQPERDGADFMVTAPSYRFDLEIEEDFIEEVARLYGYDNIPAVAPVQVHAMLPERESLRPVASLKQRVVDRGYQEVITFSFVSSARESALRIDPNPIKVLNPIASHLDVMRTSLFEGLLDTLRTNVNRKQERVRIFEVGRCFLREDERYWQPLRIAALAYGYGLPEQWDAQKKPVDFFDVKGDLEALAWPQRVSTDAAAHPALHPGRSARVMIDGKDAGWIGELHPRLLREFELPRAPVLLELDVDALASVDVPRAHPVSKLPVVRRDLAVVVDESVAAQEILDALAAAKPSHVDYISLFDVYRGRGIESGKKSLAILVLMQDTQRTLTDAEIDATVAALLRVVEDRFGGSLRR